MLLHSSKRNLILTNCQFGQLVYTMVYEKGNSGLFPQPPPLKKLRKAVRGINIVKGNNTNLLEVLTRIVDEGMACLKRAKHITYVYLCLILILKKYV